MSIWCYVIAYAIVGWLMMFALGMWDDVNSMEVELIFFAGLLWPVALILIALFNICEGIGYFLDNHDKLKGILSKVFLVFTPYTMGQELVDWFKKRKERKEEEGNCDE